VLHRLAELDAELGEATESFEFTRYTRLLTAFANDDLSAFFFDIRKDSLYCEVSPQLPAGTPKRRAYRTVLDTVFHALVRWLAPVLTFTTEEVWQTRFPDGGSVHLLEWPEIDPAWRDPALGGKWATVKAARQRVNEAIEPLRREKTIGSSLQAEIVVRFADGSVREALASVDFTEICIVSSALLEAGEDSVAVAKTDNEKCGRCWRYLPEVEEDGALCARCDGVLNG
jgi:isoleucyl-tRNA synthetase